MKPWAMSGGDLPFDVEIPTGPDGSTIAVASGVGIRKIGGDLFEFRLHAPSEPLKVFTREFRLLRYVKNLRIGDRIRDVVFVQWLDNRELCMYDRAPLDGESSA